MLDLQCLVKAVEVVDIVEVVEAVEVVEVCVVDIFLCECVSCDDRGEGEVCCKLSPDITTLHHHTSRLGFTPKLSRSSNYSFQALSCLHSATLYLSGQFFLIIIHQVVS